jgi:hypothetical protein
MHIIKIPAQNLLYIDPNFKNGKITVMARYSHGIENFSKEVENARICHYRHTIVGKVMYIQFFEMSEVFGLSDTEKKDCYGRFIMKDTTQKYF